MKSCENLLFFEKRGLATFLTVGKYPNGPTLKYQIIDCNQSDDTRFMGNCLKGSRPILIFSSDFRSSNLKKLEKNIWIDVLNLPKNHPKS